MASKGIFWLVWACFVLYSFVLAPKNAPGTRSTGTYIKQLIVGPFSDLEPYVISLFYFLGLWPLIYMSILLIDGQSQTLNGTLAAILSNALGGFILVPYMALRHSDRANNFRMNIFIRLFESKLTAIFLISSAIGLAAFALLTGDFQQYLAEFRGNHFIHVMTVDFFVLSFIFPFLIEDDWKRREQSTNKSWQFYFALSFLPLVGPLIYLYQRPELKATKSH